MEVCNKSALLKFETRFALASVCLISMVGCSTISNFFDDSGDTLPPGGFRGTSAIRHQTVPLPVEVAENILAIEDGRLVTGESSPTPAFAPNPGLEPMPSKPKSKIHPFSGRKTFQWSRRRPTSRPKRRHDGTGETQHYQVRNGDTLMKIAFAKYGNIFRWRDIYNDNLDVIKDYNSVKVGTTLVLNGIEFIVIEKNGEPYLIRKGDTLVKISRKLYQSPHYWWNLWKNNTQLIRDPDKIYAGFTMYYRPMSELKQRPRRPSGK